MTSAPKTFGPRNNRELSLKLPRRLFQGNWLYLPVNTGSITGILASEARPPVVAVPVRAISDPGVSQFIYAEYAGAGYEELERSAFLPLLKGQRWLIDVGAHFGLYSVLAAAVDPEISCIALEPAEENFAACCESLSVNGLEGRVTALQCAASDHAGTGHLRLNASMGHHLVQAPESLEGLSKVPLVTLDDLMDRFPILEAAKGSVWLKLDIEGREKSVLTGAKRLLSSGLVGGCLWEFKVGGLLNPDADEIQQTFSSNGFNSMQVGAHSILSLRRSN